MSETVDVIENQKRPHESDGITYMRPKLYRCKVCGQRLTSEEFKIDDCPGKLVEE